jgi:hypothetical protein
VAIRENQLWDMSSLDRSSTIPRSNGKSDKERIEKLRKQIEVWEWRISLARPRCRQVLHLIDKFGGILPFSIACNRHPNHIIYYWLGVTKIGNQHKKNRHGLLPSISMMLRLMSVARLYGVVLTPSDVLPDLIDGVYMRNPYVESDLVAWLKHMYTDLDPRQMKLETQIAELLEA